MIDDISQSIIQTSIDMQESLIAIFKDDEVLMSNNAFNSFFGIKNSKQYCENFGPFINNFVPHPLYFHSGKLEEGENCFDAIMTLDESDRIVSMMSPTYDPHAFSIEVKKLEEGYMVLSLEDISQTLIKKLMIDNGANIDVKSGAYTKEYFMYISQSLEEAAVFNEKNLSSTLVSFSSEDVEDTLILDVASSLHGSIRNEDMLIKWDRDSFLLVYLVDNLENVETFDNKMLRVLNTKYGTRNFSVHSVLKERTESIEEMILRVHIGV